MRRTLRLLASCTAASLVASWPAFAQQLAVAPAVCDRDALHASLAADPERISLGDARVSLVPVPGMHGIAPVEAERIVPTERGDLFLANSEGAVVSLRATDGDELLRNPRVLETVLYGRNETEGRLLGRFQWITRGEAVEQGGQRWFLFEYVYRARDRSDRYARHYWTGFQGGTLVVRFSAPLRRRSDVVASARTLRIHDCAWGGEPAVDPSTPAVAARACSAGQLRTDAQAEPGRVSTAGGRLSLVPPEGMRAMPPGAGQSDPALAFAAESGAVIMVGLGDEAPIVDSPDYQRMLERRYETGFRNLEWVAREVVEIGGARWLRLEFTGEHRGMALHHQYYLTPFQGGGATVGLVAPASAFSAVQADFAASAASLRVHDCELTS